MAALLELQHRAADPLQEVERFEARHHDGYTESLGERRILPGAHHAADVARSEKSVHAIAGRPHDRLDRRWHEHVGDEHREVFQALLAGELHRHRVGWSRRLEADGEEHDLAIGMGVRELHGVERRIDDPDVASGGLHSEEIVS